MVQRALVKHVFVFTFYVSNEIINAYSGCVSKINNTYRSLSPAFEKACLLVRIYDAEKVKGALQFFCNA